MYPSSNSNDVDQEAAALSLSLSLCATPTPTPTPSAPLQPSLEPPPLPLALPISVPPSFINSEYPTTISAPAAAAPTNKNNKLPSSHFPGPWSSGLCCCCYDIHSCCLTCCCPCVTFGRIAEIVDRGSTSCGVSGALYALTCCVTGCCPCLYSCFYRSKLRGQYFLDETPCIDCCVHCCCQQCALCQEYRQLKHHGFDMSIGWHGNMERMRRGLTVPPAPQGAMRR